MSSELTIQIRRLNPDQDADIPLPRYMTPSSSGMDICAAVSRTVMINPQSIELIPTGFAMALPKGFEAQIRPRSGLAVRHGIGLINSPGTIDADYRGEVKLALINLGNRPHPINRGDRIAQMVINRVFQAQLEEVDSLEDTLRGEGGFGHTGRR
ncbi:MAG: dUTP diphosphatase [Deltaproteobacteria bacterium]|nr:MAG: dUTP diphosphatase [Deltaproteobacteria bacterium]